MIKYRLEFNAIRNINNRIEIDIPNYNGDIIDLKGVAGQTATLTHLGDENIFDNHVYSSQAEIQVYDTGNIDLDELMLTPDLEYRMKWYRNDELYWSGFVIADGIQEQLSYRPEIQIKAVDGLHSMNGLDINITNPRGIDMGNYTSSIRCPLNILRQCLNTVKNTLPINWMVKTVNTKYFDADVLAGLVDWSPRGEILTMKKMDCYVIFEEILRSFNLHCFQMNGEWYIVNIIDLANNQYNFSGYRIVDLNSTTVEGKDFELDLVGISINNVGVRTLKKPISKVEVTYEATRDENIVPNGSMNYVDSTTNNVIYWGGGIPNVYETSSVEGISGRIKDKYDLTDSALELITQVPTGVTFHDGSQVGLPFDAKTLFPRFTLGLSVMPMNFPVYDSGDKKGQIKWDETKPLQLEVTYDIIKDGVMTTWYLNENGYWQNEPRGQNLGIFPSKIEDSLITGSVYSVLWKAYFKGSPNIGDKATLLFNDTAGDNRTASFTATVNEENQLEVFLIKLKDNIDWGYNRQVHMVSAEEGYISFQMQLLAWNSYRGDLKTSTEKTGELQDFKKINLISDQSQNEDVIRFQFTSKGGESRIKIPEPTNLTDYGNGILRYYIHHNGAYTSVIDDVYINIDENYDKYTLTIPNKKDSNEEYTLKISSSFSGFLLSSYMNSWSTCNQTMMYNRYGVDATLTEHYGRDVLKLKSTPYQIIDNDYKGLVTPLTLINDNMLPMIKCIYNAYTDISSVTCMEFKINDISNIEVTHKGSNDDNIS